MSGVRQWKSTLLLALSSLLQFLLPSIFEVSHHDLGISKKTGKSFDLATSSACV